MKYATYKRYLEKYGTTSRERTVNLEKMDLLKKAQDNPSYKECFINGETHYLLINDGTLPYYKNYYTLPNDNIYAGDIVEWSNAHWLIKNMDFDDEIYGRGELIQCNWVLKWQNKNGEIIERWVVVQNATAYNTGTNGDNVIKLGYDQLLLLIPVDDETIRIDRGMRFFIDNNRESPTVYQATKIDTVAFMYEGHGYVSVMLSEDQYNIRTDNIELMVCDYHENNNNQEDDTQEDLFDCEIIGSDSLRCGNKKGLKLECVVDNDYIPLRDYHWEVNSTFNDGIRVETDGKYITLYVDDEQYINSLINVIVSSNSNKFKATSKLIKVVSYY